MPRKRGESAMLGGAALSGEKPILVWYDFDYGWIIEVPVVVDGGVEYEFAENHVYTGLPHPYGRAASCDRAPNKRDTLLAAKSIGRSVGLSVEAENAGAKIALARVSQRKRWLQHDLRQVSISIEHERRTVAGCEKRLRRLARRQARISSTLASVAMSTE